MFHEFPIALRSDPKCWKNFLINPQNVGLRPRIRTFGVAAKWRLATEYLTPYLYLSPSALI